jgi:hypothetical protein
MSCAYDGLNVEDTTAQYTHSNGSMPHARRVARGPLPGTQSLDAITGRRPTMLGVMFGIGICTMYNQLSALNTLFSRFAGRH